METVLSLIAVCIGLCIGQLASMGVIKLFKVLEPKYPVLAWVYMVTVLGSCFGLLLFAFVSNL